MSAWTELREDMLDSTDHDYVRTETVVGWVNLLDALLARDPIDGTLPR